MKFESFPNTFKKTAGFCPNRPVTNGKRQKGDIALINDIPFGYNKNLDIQYESNELNILCTLKLPTESDEVYLLRFSFGKHRLGLKIGKNLKVEYSENNKVTSYEYENTSVTDDDWHRIAVGIKGKILTVFVDCLPLQQMYKLKSEFTIKKENTLGLEFGQRGDDSGPGFVV